MVNLPSKYEHVGFVTTNMLPLSSITAMPTCGLHKAICMTVNCLNIWTHTQTAANITDAHSLSGQLPSHKSYWHQRVEIFDIKMKPPETCRQSTPQKQLQSVSPYGEHLSDERNFCLSSEESAYKLI